MLKTDTINELIGIDDSWKAPEKLLSIMLDKSKRTELFKSFLAYETDVSFDWFHMYFQDEAADRKKKKQDFTPQSISKLMNKLVDNDDSDMYFEPAAGTGGIAIEHYYQQRLKQLPWDYKPSEHYHTLEELSDRAIPFLLFNMAIRGMNATVIQIYSWSNEHYPDHIENTLEEVCDAKWIKARQNEFGANK